MRLRAAAIAMLVMSSVGLVPGVAQATSATIESVIAEAYQQWGDALGMRQECASGVSITLEALPARRGEYRVATREVVIDPDGDIATLTGVVIHELSHHAFVACGAFADQDLTVEFFAAQHLPPDRDWFDYSTGWDQAPVEHFAEAMAVAINGTGASGIEVTPEAVSLVTRWLAAAPIAHQANEDHVPVAYAPMPSSGDKEGSTASVTIRAEQPTRQVEQHAEESDRPELSMPEIVRLVNRMLSLMGWTR